MNRFPRTVPRAAVLLILILVPLVGAGRGRSNARQDPCHRRHSCPSDHGTYICGDLGRCDQCPDNQYCLAGKPRAAAQPVPHAPPPAERPGATASCQAFSCSSGRSDVSGRAWLSVAGNMSTVVLKLRAIDGDTWS
jgi:hypothetical protein